MLAVDCIFHGGDILTMDGDTPAAEAVVVAAGKIVKVGHKPEVMALRGPKTDVIDLGGTTLMPGFVEAHGHPLFSALTRGEPVIRAVHTPTYDAVLEKVRRRVAKAKAGEFIMAVGLDPTLHQGMHEPTRDELDAMAPNNTLVVTLFNFDGVDMNSQAVKACGYENGAPGHLDECIIPDAKGRPWKFTEEMAKRVRYAFYEACGKDRAVIVLKEWVEKFTRASHTTSAEIGMFPQWSGYFDAMRKEHALPLRMRLYEQVFIDTPFVAPVGDGDDRLKAIGAKLWADGSLFVGNTAMTCPYLTTDTTVKRMGMPPNDPGSTNYSREVLNGLMERAITYGWQLAVPAQGDATVDMVLDIYEDLLGRLEANNGPYRLEHCTMMRPDQAERAHRLGLVCSFFSTIAYYWGDAMREDMFGHERGDAVLPFGTATRAGMRFSYHCDSPMTWPTPLLCVYFAVTRKTLSGKVLSEGECAGIETALRGITIDAAYHLQMDHLVGSISEGKQADFVRLDKNPLLVTSEQLKEIAVRSTYIDGVQVSGDGSAAYR